MYQTLLNNIKIYFILINVNLNNYINNKIQNIIISKNLFHYHKNNKN
jgi:hypothetical protein